MNNGTIFLDYNLLIRRYTLAAQKIYRLAATDVGRSLGDIRSYLESGDLQAKIQDMLEMLVPFEREVRTTDGAWYLARIQPYRTPDNVIDGVALSFTEVTTFKLASEAVQRSEAMLATAQELAQLGSRELDVANDSVHWSSEMFKLFGCPPVDTPMSMQDMLKFVIQEDRERVAAAIGNSVASRLPYDIMYRVTRQDGTTCKVRSRGKAITDDTGRVASLIGTTLDITESRQAERVRQGVVQLATQLSGGILDSVSDPLIVLDDGLQVVSASRSFYQHFQVTAEQTVDKNIYDLGNGQWDIPALRDMLENILPHDHVLDGYVVEHDFPGLGRLRMVINARRIVTAIGNTKLILLAMVAIEDGANP